MSTDVFSQYESEVRSYCRAFPVVFRQAKGSHLIDESGTSYLDFFAGAGSLNLGHNHPEIKAALIDYLQDDGLLHGLDMYTTAKRSFLQALNEVILAPRGYHYLTQFPGPTGTNAVEAALKLARKVKQRTGVFAFQGGFHGMTLGSLAVTGNKTNRAGAAQPLPNVTFMPFPHGFMESFDTIEYMRQVIKDPNSGIEKPAAILLETVQAEGGVIVAKTQWLQQVRELCDEFDILMIVDDIQVGCGRTGSFFSFEEAGIQPDIVTLSKSISGCGLPLALVLLKPELDIWSPGEHNGTFRGNQLAFIGGAKAISLWGEENIQSQVKEKEKFICEFMSSRIQTLDERLAIRGVGLIWGVDLSALDNPALVDDICMRCFDNQLIIENAGRAGQVLKLLPPLNIRMEDLQQGCEILAAAIAGALQPSKGV